MDGSFQGKVNSQVPVEQQPGVWGRISELEITLRDLDLFSFFPFPICAFLTFYCKSGILCFFIPSVKFLNSKFFQGKRIGFSKLMSTCFCDRQCLCPPCCLCLGENGHAAQCSVLVTQHGFVSRIGLSGAGRGGELASGLVVKVSRLLSVQGQVLRQQQPLGVMLGEECSWALKA